MSDITFVDIQETPKSNEYDEIVVALDAAGPGKAYPLTAPTADIAVALRRFQEAAHRVDRTARKVKGTETIDGDNTTVQVALRPKIERKRKDADAETVEA